MVVFKCAPTIGQLLIQILNQFKFDLKFLQDNLNLTSVTLNEKHCKWINKTCEKVEPESFVIADSGTHLRINI